jgi:hypothetical protein
MPTIEPGTYTVTVLRIEDMEPGQYGERMRWVLALTDEDGAPVTWDNGDPYEWWQQTGTTLGPKSTARKWADALMGRDLRDGDDGDDVADALIGKSARALIDIGETGFARIVGLTPLKRRAKAAPVEAEEDTGVF